MDLIMKRYILLVLFFGSICLKADYSIKTVDGYYKIKSSSAKNYVCYKARIINEGNGDFAYIGCARYKYNCKSNNKAHFGKYPNNRSVQKALARCQHSNPRFMD